MLNPKSTKDRLSYGDILAPEPGFVLKNAITTTYSLDLETLVASTIALSLGEATDSELVRNPLNLLYAIRRAADKVIVFCDSTQTKLPRKRTKLLELLENSIVQVSLPELNFKGNYPSFHPKIWILQYENSLTKERSYRLIVMSRNLTFDHSWDVSVCLDGYEADTTDSRTQPIIDFVSFLRKQVSDKDTSKIEKLAMLDAMISDLSKVSFSVEDSDFEDFEILPLGIGAVDINSDYLFEEKSYEDLLVISPFVSKSTITKLMSQTNLSESAIPTLLTRRSELAKLKDVMYEFDIVCLKDEIVDGEQMLEDDVNADEIDNVPKEDIHAKLYAKQLFGETTLYLGSMNASENGTNRNVEILLKLKGSGYSPDDIFANLGGYDEKGPLEFIDMNSINFEEIPEEKNEDYEGVLKEIFRLNISAKVTENNGLYDLELHFENYQPNEFAIRISPFSAAGLEKELSEKTIFEGLKIEQLSQFYCVSVGDISRIMIIPTEGIPDDREKLIIKSIIDSRRKLSEYIAYILGDDSLATFSENEDDLELTDADNNGKSKSYAQMLPLYEKMLKIAYIDKDRLKEIDDILEIFWDDEEIVTQEFKEMYEVFKSTLNLKK